MGIGERSADGGVAESFGVVVALEEQLGRLAKAIGRTTTAASRAARSSRASFHTSEILVAGGRRGSAITSPNSARSNQGTAEARNAVATAVACASASLGGKALPIMVATGYFPRSIGNL